MSTVKFNDKELPDFVKLVSREIAVLPEIDVKSMELPRQLGSSFLYTNLGKKKEALEFTLIPSKVDSIDSASIKFAEWLRGDNFKPSKIIFGDKPDRYGLAQVNGSVSVSDLFIYGKISVEFLYLDPVAYKLVGIDVSGTTAFNVEYDGEIPQPFNATFIVVAASSKIELRSNKTTKKIILNGTFSANTRIQVDTSKKQVFVNGILNMKVISFDSEWFNLETGRNTLSVYANNSAASGTNISVKSKIAVY